MKVKRSSNDWACPKCEYTLRTALPVVAAEHTCPKNRNRTVALKPQ